MSRPSASTFASPPGPVLPGPSGRSVPVSGWDRGTAIAEETDNDPEPHRPQQASRTVEAGTPARTGESWEGGGRAGGEPGTWGRVAGPKKEEGVGTWAWERMEKVEVGRDSKEGG